MLWNTDILKGKDLPSLKWLITLGIIGVVAVLTLTTVIPEIQINKTLPSGKKEYSVIKYGI